MISGNKYLSYSPEEFAADAYFQSWIMEGDEMADTFWKNWMKAHPHKQNEIHVAIELVQATSKLRFKEYKASESDFNEVWHDIVMQHSNQTSQNTYMKNGPFSWKWLAAACVILLVSGIFLYKYQTKEQILYYSTGYNEVVDIVLPDGSRVVLNANSSISYDRKLESDRRVYLEGEGFFSVVHTVDHQKFTVYANGLGVEVLGTEFEVKNRRGKMRVILQSGKVKLNLPNYNYITRPQEEIVMQPGELIEYSEKHKGVMKKKVDTDNYIAWTRNEMVFENNSLSEVAEVIEDQYGYNVKFENETLQNKVFTARINDKSDINLLINILQETFNLNIYKNENDLIMESK